MQLKAALGKLRAYSGHTLGLLWAYLGHTLGTLWANSGQTLGTLWALRDHSHSEHAESTPGEYPKDTQRTLREHPENNQGRSKI